MPESLNCNSCGAPLDVPTSARFVKCNHCNANLQVHRSDGGTFTEAVEKLTETTEDLAQQVEKLTRHNELAELDRCWEVERRSFMSQAKDGHSHLPIERVAWVGGIGAIVFGGLWTILAFSITQSGPSHGVFSVAKIIFPLFGLGFIGFGVFNAIFVHQRAQNYRRVERNYRLQRDQLLRED
jgi:LSD1 subclass zinc finger protein